MAGADPGAELAAAEHGEAEHSEPDGEMASSSLTGLLTNRSRGEQHSAANYSGALAPARAHTCATSASVPTLMPRPAAFGVR